MSRKALTFSPISSPAEAIVTDVRHVLAGAKWIDRADTISSSKVDLWLRQSANGAKGRFYEFEVWDLTPIEIDARIQLTEPLLAACSQFDKSWVATGD
ncbi:MAG TPA: hypothetical protein VN325_20215 [Steroidobacteraceae bacterium]|nr:hypothetical protein [Steroidobacteraceae bacterium]